ncbi:MAG TPA: InlB B-repeat-containing protein, partial [Bacilli bacterium]|nr:InlB B-repeat-containing protein [Bacilli bacterium]
MKKLAKFFSILFFVATISFVFLTTMPMVASGMTEQEMVNRDTELVTVPEVTIGSFPVAVHSVYGNIITWESSDENVVFMDGWFVVKRQKDADINATITVTVTRPNNPEIQATREFNLLVPKGVTVRAEYTITYHNVENTEGYKTSYLLGDETYVLPVPTKENYLFEGWFTDAGFNNRIERIVVGSKQNFDLYAKWRVANAPYTVSHQLENLDETFTEELSEPFEGLIGSVVSAEPMEFEGFEYSETISSPSGTVLEDGNLILVLKYTRKSYILTINDGLSTTSVTKKYGESLNLPVQYRDGYQFDGWDTEYSTMPSRDLTVNAKWTALEVDYKVEFYFENLSGDYVLNDDETLELKAKTDSTVSVPEVAFAGFTLNDSHPDKVMSGEVLGDGSLVLKAYYSRNSYTLTIVYDNGEENYVQVLKYGETIDVETPEKEGFTFAGWEPELPETMPANDLTVKAKWSALPVYQVSFDSTGGSSVQTQNVIEGQKATRPADPTKQGYEFAGWFLDLSDVVPYDFDAGVYGPITLYAKWTEGTSSYKVEHYLQDLEGNYTILHDTEELEGTTNSLAEAVGLTLTGFEYNSELSTASGIIEADGSLVLKLYYTRNTYTITIDLNDGSTPYSVYRKYEEAVDIDDPTRTGYDFDEWEIVLPEEMTVLPETMPAENISLKALWNPAEVFYTVKHYKQNLDGSYSQADFSEELKALTGSMVFATPNEYTGFTFDGDNSITEGTVKADGTLELVLYYTRNQYTLTIKSENSDDLEATYLYEQPIEYPVLSRPGYEIVGWNT